MSPDLGRRSFLLLGVGTLAAGCSAASTTEPSSPPTPAGPSATPARSPSASVTPLPEVTRWHADPGDVDPAAKRAAVRTIERRGNTHRTALQVIAAQYGGILASSASVLVVTRSWARAASGAVRPDGATYDVRVIRSTGGWRVVAVHRSRPGPRSGHPRHVFGTSRLSDHPQGRAFDTWRIDGHPVVDGRTPRALVAGFMEAAAAAGSYNVGGPYLLGSAPQFFSDATHHDHVHAGFAR